MQILDSIWWRGLHRLAACEIYEEGGGQVLFLHKNGNKIKTEAPETFESDAQLQDRLRDLKMPVLLCMRGKNVRSALLSAEQQADPCSAILGVQVGQSDDFICRKCRPEENIRRWP